MLRIAALHIRTNKPVDPTNFEEKREITCDMLAVGSLFDNRYQIELELGRGGASVVYQAKDKLLDREVALKVLNKNLEQKQLDRFRAEIHACSGISHSGIVSILSSGISDSGHPYIVMELLQGQTLERLLADRKTIDKELFAQIFLQVLDALAFAHNTVIHRDLKPGNIMISGSPGSEEGVTCKVLDFGIAKILEPTNALPQGDTVGFLGSPLYMSPEQISGAAVDARADIYSLACIMYQALSGQAPFAKDTAFETMYEHMHNSRPKMIEISKSMNISAELIELIIQALSKEPEKRPQTAQEFRRKLEAALSSNNIVASKFKSKHLKTLLILALLIPLSIFLIKLVNKTHKAEVNLMPERAKRHQFQAMSGFALKEEAERLRSSGQYDEAIEKYKKAIPLLEGIMLCEARYDLGCLLMMKLQYEDAMKQFKCCMEISPQVSTSKFLNATAKYAMLLSMTGHQAESEILFKTTADKAASQLQNCWTPELANFHSTWAQACLSEGRLEEAKMHALEVLAKWKKTGPPMTEAAVLSTWVLSDVYEKQKCPKRALEIRKAGERALLADEDSGSSELLRMFASEAKERKLYAYAKTILEAALKKANCQYDFVRKSKTIINCKEELKTVETAQRKQEQMNASINSNNESIEQTLPDSHRPAGL